MRIQVPEPLQAFARVFASAGVRGYAVGGLVRNAMLGYPASDVDLASQLTPEEADALFTSFGANIVPKGLKFGTIEIHYEGIVVEHTTFRGESYLEGGAHRPKDVWFSKQLFDDASRRDFTVNALYAELETGEIIDPTGGLDDVKHRVLRATSPDPAAILSSDALRILRLARFAAELGFALDERTAEVARENADKLKDIAQERIRDELTRILLADMKYGRGTEAVLEGLLLLDALGILDVILPELAEGRDIPQRTDYHRYRVLEHAFHTAAATPPELALRLAGLFHDVAKPVTLSETGRFIGHDRRGEPLARAILTRLRYPNTLINRVSLLVKYHMYDIQGTAKEDTLRQRFGDWGRQFSRDMILLREADIHGSGLDTDYVAERWRGLLLDMERRHTPFSVMELAVTGSDLMQELNIPPSPKVGALIDALWRVAVLKPELNTREKLLRRARSLLHDLQ